MKNSSWFSSYLRDCCLCTTKCPLQFIFIRFTPPPFMTGRASTHRRTYVWSRSLP